MATNSLSSSAVSSGTVQRVPFSRLWRTGLLAIVLANVANLIVYAAASPFITVPPEFIPLSTPMPTVFFTTGGVLAAIIVFAIVGRLTRQPARVYTIVAIIALLISFIPDIAMIVDPGTAANFPGANWGSVSVLMLQHVVAAVVVVWLLNTRAIEQVPAGK
jgi:hypothetical protein